MKHWKTFIKNRYVLFGKGLASLILATLLGACTFSLNTHENLPTYFSYAPEEISKLDGLRSDEEISMEDVYKWEDIIFEIVSENKVGTAKASRIYTYLIVAQRDAAYLSFNTHKKFMGSIDPVSKEVICVFFPDDCQNLVIESDTYSEQLASTVMTKVNARVLEDEQMNRVYDILEGDNYWTRSETELFSGQDVGSWKTWLISSPQEFRLAPPPAPGSVEDEEQIQRVRDTLGNLTVDQEVVVVRWAGVPGTKTAAAQWLDLISNHMQDTNHTNLEEALMIRSILVMTVADTVIAATDSKYTYWAERPFAKDASITTVMPTPNHPSYPSSSAAIASAGAEIAAFYFPEKSDEWNTLAEEIGNSRIWSGIHFPIDVEAGASQGIAVAQEFIKQLSE